MTGEKSVGKKAVQAGITKLQASACSKMEALSRI